ncbi:MAG: ribonuclease P protein component [Candidatus Shapirobacteria bacterium]
MLKKINRLKKIKDFTEVKNKGEIYHSPFFSLLILKSDNKDSQFGFVISKKISKRAVDRNKIKRVLAESVKVNLDKFKNIKAVFLVKRLILGKKFEEVDREIKKIIK